MVHGWRAMAIFKQRRLLLDWETRVDPAVTAIEAALWCLLFIFAAISILRRWPIGRWVPPVFLMLSAVTRLLLTGMIRGGFDTMLSDPVETVPVSLVAWLIIAVITGWLLNRKLAREFFIAKHRS
jgi:hypothetical protein